MRNLVLFSDGTGNSSAKAEKTNVWRMYQALDTSSADQFAKYDDGVGTSSIKFLAAIGGAFGWGLKRNVLDLYKFVCRHYEDGDRIYGFGFSRGAFTIRVLASMIGSQGLVCYRSEEELDRRAAVAYRHYRKQCFPAATLSPVRLVRALRDTAIDLLVRVTRSTPYKAQPRKLDIPIHFLGLWDTVSAYGMPVEEFKPAVNWLVWPMLFDDLALPVAVRHACHALSLDDERTTFHPLVWDETAECRLAEKNPTMKGRLKQVWFSGAHANVGGGYPEDQLAMITLDWMMQNAIEHKLRLINTFVDIARAARSPYGQLYDPRAGLGSFYRYTPRQIKRFKDLAGKEILPVIHGSVIMRLACGTDRYAPVTLPTDFLVLAPNGQLLPMTGPGAGAAPLAPADPATIALQQAMATLAKPNAQAIELALDTVWWRRVCYFFAVALAVALLAFPLYGDVDNDSASKSTRGMIEPTVSALSALVPSQAESWIAALRGSPIKFSVLLALLAVAYKFGNILQARIRDRAMFGWHSGLTNAYLQWLADHERRSRAVAAAIGIAAVLALLATCTLRMEKPVQVCFIAGIVLGWAVWRILRATRQLKFLGRIEDKRLGTLPSTLSLRFAHFIRRHDGFVTAYRFYAQKLVPAIFVLGMVSTALLLANRSVFDIENSAGNFCIPTSQLDQEKEHLPVGATFTTSAACFATGIVLERDGRYRITLSDNEGNWFDRAIHTDIQGFPAFEAIHVAATPLKRWWTADWFAPIARVGQFGNEEYLMKSAAAYHTRKYDAVPPIAGSHREPISDRDAQDLQKAAPTSPERRVLVAHITAKSSGELFLFVNDAVFAAPLAHDYFYSNNRGTATIKVERLAPSGAPD